MRQLGKGVSDIVIVEGFARTLDCWEESVCTPIVSNLVTKRVRIHGLGVECTPVPERKGTLGDLRRSRDDIHS